MVNLGSVLSGLGFMGVLGAIVLGFLAFLVIPVWSIFDCAYSKLEKGTKVLVVILLLLSWSLGSLIYSVFFSESKVLRKFSIFSICGSILLFGFSCSTFLGGAKLSRDVQKKQDLIQEKQLIADFKPETIDPNSINEFKAIRFVQSQFPPVASVSNFIISGPKSETAFNVDDSQIRHLTHDAKNNRYYGITSHDFGSINASDGHFEKIEMDPILKKDFSWPKGIAFELETGEISILSSHVENSLFFYNPKKKKWRRVLTGNRQSLIAMTYSPEEKIFYALTIDTKISAIRALVRLNNRGADLGTLPLATPIPIMQGQKDYFQMTFSSGKIILLVPSFPDAPQEIFKKDRIFAIDPKEGKVFVSKEM